VRTEEASGSGKIRIRSDFKILYPAHPYYLAVSVSAGCDVGR